MAKHIVVFGSPGSGKSVFCAALAKTALNHKKRTVILSDDPVIPMLPFYCGASDTLGLGALCAGKLSPETVAQAVKIIKDYPDIGVIGTRPEDRSTDITKERLLRIADLLDNLVDLVIWDSSMSMEIMEQGDLRVCILTADIKGLLYFEQFRQRIRQKSCVILEGLAKPYTAYEEMSMRIGGLDGRLNYGREVERIYLEGDIFSVDDVCHAEYADLAEQLMRQVLYGEGE